MRGPTPNSRPSARSERRPRSRGRVSVVLAILLGLFVVPVSHAVLPHGARSAKRSVVKSGALRRPSLQRPGNGAKVQALPTFEWAAVPKATAYQFQLSADKRFASVVQSFVHKGSIETPNTAATLDKAVPNGAYYWRVRAVSSKNSSGPWSAARKLTKSWTSAPQLLQPTSGDASQPLVFKWSSVPFAVKYQLTVATDPNFANQVLGTKTAPVTTQGTVYTPGIPFDSGVSYYWQVTPIDAEGHKGAPSQAASFTYTWASETTTEVKDLNADPRVFDPLFSWAPVPGAVRYEVEVNAAEGFPPGSKWCCSGTTIGTSLAPTKVLANNRYYWRVRALDAKANAGVWNEGSSFTKAFDSVTPSIPGLTVREPDGGAAGGVPETSTPIVTWNPVPGASLYQVQLAPYRPLGCDWSAVGKNPPLYQAETATTAWTPLGTASASGEHIGPPAWPRAQFTPRLRTETSFTADITEGSDILSAAKLPVGASPEPGDLLQGPGIPEDTTIIAVTKTIPASVEMSREATATTSGATVVAKPRYCVQVFARSDNDAQQGQVVSEPTQLNGPGQPAFTLTSQSLEAPQAPFVTPPGAYLQPSSGTVTPRTPYFAWNPVAGAQGYYVVVARDAGFTEVADVGFTNVPAYAPRLANEAPLSDETTAYYWVAIPATGADGSGAFSAAHPQEDSPQTFQKESAAPGPIAPGNGATVSAQPTFQWGSAENARTYRIQVAQDPSFGHPLEDATTDATAYTSSTTYPAGVPLYWRVRANDWSGQGLKWSPVWHFVRTLAAPEQLASTPAAGEPIPVLSWSPIQGAVGYELHFDKVNGTSANFTVPAAAGTPTEWYGVGVWRWQVRATFPGAVVGQTITGSYSPLREFVRTLTAPTGARGVKSGNRLVISWSPDAAAKQYEVDLATSDGFARTLESHRTDNTSWAPLVKLTAAQQRGPLFWRVAAIDGAGNLGSFASGKLGKARASCARSHARKGNTRGSRKPSCAKRTGSKKSSKRSR
jgi:hypothetical protein